ncbi:histidine phosphatase family protein [Mycobacterium sp.]|jgi:probable phosphoglycerate mutase|uniref:histidine phosphatase family protein n=1 Tax=Mycobacterium sp. TaxID=1785 RepID=UPI002D6FDE7C|nr:histidine phosphatase family protein [Mycobacterium sp.]HZA10127.1 histidine phosphatase family protein [Mycobacterium sp.]
MSGRLVLVRHGQSVSNVERRLDTRPPGSGLTPLGVAQARDFARGYRRPLGMLVHSVAVRAQQTAAVIGDELGMRPKEVEGIHEVQVGDLEMRNDDDAVETFNKVYERWHLGELETPMPGGERGRDALDRYLPVLADLRMRYLDDDDWTGDIVVISHGAAIRLAAAVLAGVDGSFVVEHHLGNGEAVILSPITDGRWSCTHWGQHSPPFLPDPHGMPAPEDLESADPMG